jgi:DNA-binding FadR family transcriptional regulator
VGTRGTGKAVVPLNPDAAAVLDVLISEARVRGSDVTLSTAELLERTELSRAALIEAVEGLEAEGHVEVRWNLNGMFHAKLSAKDHADT